MTKCIPVTTCLTCPHRDHKGAFGRIAYIPICRLSGRELPYKAVFGKFNSVSAHVECVIPDDCPLPNRKPTTVEVSTSDQIEAVQALRAELIALETEQLEIGKEIYKMFETQKAIGTKYAAILESISKLKGRYEN